ncbi:hypothetical protein N9177_00500 [bacterium]|nr:hypothetical protein [bacterium]
MARIDQYSTRQPSRTDILLGTDEPTGRTSNFSLADLEDFLLSNKGDRKIPIEQRIDLTSSEPENPVSGGRYLNTVTGTSSITSTAVVADYIYELRAGEWVELIPVEGFTLWDKGAKENITYAGAGYGWVANTVSGAQLTSGLDGVNNSLDQNFTFDENGNITGFSEAFTSTVNTTVAGEGFATAQSVSAVGVNLNTLTGNFNSKVIDDTAAFAGIPHTFKQDDAPTDSDPKFIRNSVWYDTNDGNRAYVLEPQSETPNAPLVWVEATDERLGELVTEVGAQKNILIDTNGHVSGMTMGNFGPDRSYISFLADRFKIYTYDENTAGGSVSNPFVVENGKVKISQLATRDITVGDVPPEAQSTVIFATTSNGANASTSKFDTDSGGNITLTRTHVFLANTRWVDGDSLDNSWVFERIAGVNGTSVNIEGSVNDVASLPTTGNSPGDGYLISGNLYVWDGSQWNNAGNIQGPEGNDGITPSFGLDYQNGADGSFHSYIYKVSDTQPTRPPSTGTAFYQGSFDGISEIIPDGWTDSPSVSTEDVEWVSKAIYENTKTYHPTTGAETTTWAKRTTSGHDWSEPVKIYQKGDVGDTGTPGADAYTVVLANESHTVPVSAVGVHNYTGSGTSIVAYKGGTELQGRVSGTPGAGQFTVTPNTSGIGIDGSPSVSSGSKQVTIPDMQSMTSDTASITYSINLEDNITITKKQTFTKSQDGQPGQDGSPGESITGTPGSPGKKTATGLIFYQVSSANAPSLPIAGNTSFDFTDGSVSGLTSNWNTATPSLGPGTSTSTFWSSRYYAVETNANSDAGTLTFDTPVSMYSFDQVVTFTALGSPGDTIIDGGRIKTNTLSADTLSTGTIDADEITIAGALNSSNYSQNGENGFAAAGTEINLSNGSIHSKNFKIDPDGSASFGGAHGAGSIGNWNITADGVLKDNSNRISLDPTSKSVTMRDGSGDLKVLVSSAEDLSTSLTSNISVASQTNWQIGPLNYSLATDTSAAITDRSYSSHSSIIKESTSGGFIIPSSGTYEIDSSDFTIQPYSSSFIDSIVNDMPNAGYTVDSTMSQGLYDTLTSLNYVQYGVVPSDIEYARAKIETILEVGHYPSGSWVTQEEKVLARQEIINSAGTFSYFSRTSSEGAPTSFSPWRRIEFSTDNPVIGDFEIVSDGNLILDLEENNNSYVKLALKVTVLPSVSANSGQNALNDATRSINHWTFGRTSGYFTPITGSINILAPSNFSELSGGGLQVVTNTDRYARMVRHTPTSATGNTTNLLEVKGGETILKNIGATALKLYGGSSTTDLLEIFGPFSCNSKFNGVDVTGLFQTSFNAAGWKTSLPGGLQIIGGYFTNYTDNSQTVNLPYNFSNGFINIQTTLTAGHVYKGGYSTNYFQVDRLNDYDNSQTIYYVAFGH